MIAIIVYSFVFVLPALIAIDRGRLLLSIMLFAIVVIPIIFDATLYWPKEPRWVVALFQFFCWLVAFAVAVRCQPSLNHPTQAPATRRKTDDLG